MKHTQKILTKILIPLLLVVLIQSIIYQVFFEVRFVKTLNSSSESILMERVENRQNEINTSLLSKWKNLPLYNNEINEIYNQSSFPNPLYSDDSLKKKFLQDSSDILFNMLRRLEVNGVFLFLTNTNEFEMLENEKQYYGICIRDYDTYSIYKDKEDLLVFRCPASLITPLGCPIDSFWEKQITFNQQHPGDFFYKPLKQAYEEPNISMENLVYFSGAHSYMDDDKKVISYSIPLKGDDGVIYGVLGIEYTVSHFINLLPSDELEGTNNSAYALVKYNHDSNVMEIIASSGNRFKQWYGDLSSIIVETDKIQKGELYFDKGRLKEDICLVVSPFKIYNSNTPFEKEIVALVGITTKDVLYATSTSARTFSLIIYFSLLVVSVITVCFISNRITKPIKKLAIEVQKQNNKKGISLFHTKIYEIDRLVDAIETQSETINKSLARTEFFSRMSHDLRTPMNAIIGFSSPDVVSMCNYKELIQNINKINSSSKYLLGLINEVLDMTKIESGKMEIESQPINLLLFWNDIISMMKEVALQKEIIFINKIPNEEKFVLGDQQRLSKIVVNILSNAIKFTNIGGKVELLVNYTLHDDKLHCHIDIKDTGIGMSEEFQQKMFQPFVQEVTTKEGTGLGLSIVKQLLDLMQGTIECNSIIDKGTNFSIDLDFIYVDKETLLQNDIIESYNEEELQNLLKDKRILLCEDNEINSEIVILLLKKYQMQVDIAENGEIGINKFNNSSIGYYDIILMDIRMPIIDGLEATMRIRHLEREDAKKIPIIAMTANAFDDDRKFSKEAGMDSHISKPIDTKQLYSLLYHYININNKE